MSPGILYKRLNAIPFTRDLLALTVLAVAGLFFVALAYHHYGNGLVSDDSTFSAQAARNLADGGEYRTSVLSLYEANLFAQKGMLDDGPPWPNGGRAPLRIVIGAVFIRLFGDSLFPSVFLYSILFYFCSIAAAYFAVRALSGDRLVAFLGSFFLALSPVHLFDAITGEETTAISAFFWLTVLILAVWHRAPSGSNKLLLLVGGLIGAAYLSNFFIGAILLPIVLVWLIFTQKRTLAPGAWIASLGRASWVVIGFGALTAPWFAVNTVLFGSPFFSSTATMQLVGFTRSLGEMNPWGKFVYPFDTGDPWAFVWQHLDDFAAKARHFTWVIGKDFLFLGRSASFTSNAWLWVPATYAVLAAARPPKSDGSLGRSGHSRPVVSLAGLLAVLTFAHLLLLPILSASTEYQHYLYGLVGVLAAYGVVVMCGEVGQRLRLGAFRTAGLTQPSKPDSRLIGDPSEQSWFGAKRSMSNGVLLAWCLGTALGVSVTVSNTVNGSAQVTLGLLAVILACGVLLWRFGTTAPVVVAIVIFAMVPASVQFGQSGKAAVERTLRQQLDLKDHTLLESAAGLAGDRGIVISSSPMALAWRAKIATLPTPEYPDDVFLILQSEALNQRIRGLHLRGIDLRDRSNERASFLGYERAISYGYAPKGFSVRLWDPIKGMLLLERHDGFPARGASSETSWIDFGQHEETSHLIWGWSQDLVEDGRTTVRAIPQSSAYAPREAREIMFEPPKERTALTAEASVGPLAHPGDARARFPRVAAIGDAYAWLPCPCQPGRLLSIYGTDLTQSELASPGATMLNGTRVLVDTRPAVLSEVMPNRINFFLPESVAAPSARINVEVLGQMSLDYIVPIADTLSLIPDSELTFLVDSRLPRRVHLLVKSPVPNQVVWMVLNANLRARTETGTLISRPVVIAKANEWTEITVDMADKPLVRGVNKLSFKFGTGTPYALTLDKMWFDYEDLLLE